jgi:hypothetical protein
MRLLSIAPQVSPMKKPTPKARTAAIRARMKPSVKATAEQLAQKEARPLADWLERLIAAEAAQRDGKSGKSRRCRAGWFGRRKMASAGCAGLLPDRTGSTPS